MQWQLRPVKQADWCRYTVDSTHDVFGEAEQLAMSNPRPTMPRPRINTRPPNETSKSLRGSVEDIEMGPTSRAESQIS